MSPNINCGHSIAWKRGTVSSNYSNSLYENFTLGLGCPSTSETERVGREADITEEIVVS